MKKIYANWIFVAVLLLPAIATSQTATKSPSPKKVVLQSTELDVENFKPKAIQKTAILNVGTTDLLIPGIPSFGVFVHFVDDPLQLRATDDSENYRLLDDQLKTEFSFGLGLFNLFEVGAIFPVTVYQKGDSLSKYNGEARNVKSFAFGDPRINLKTTFFRYGGLGGAMDVVGYLPLGNTQNFHSDGVFRIQPDLILDWQSNTIRVSANIGYQFRSERVLRNVGSNDWILYGAGLQYNFTSNIGVLATLTGGMSLADGRNPKNLTQASDNTYGRPLESHAGLRVDLADDWTLNFGGGLGLTKGIGAPDFRIFGGIEYVAFPEGSKSKDLTPEEEKQAAKSALDSDEDGIADINDRCPQEMEDIDGFEDTDGCPDDDNDKDGILDLEDECLNTPGIPEKQGCPFVDADKDGIDDESDACPQKAEDFDKFEDDDGCPELDNDRDGIADTEDKCPLQPEVINGVDDEDGCPDTSDSKVRITQNRIEIFEKVYFDSGKATIQERSKNILNQVRSVLRANPQITKIRIEGHTDNRGSAKSNLDLSQRRADAVKKYLADAGIEPSRFVAKGFGELRPIADNKSKSGLQENRRVEFFILEVKPKE